MCFSPLTRRHFSHLGVLAWAEPKTLGYACLTPYHISGPSKVLSNMNFHVSLEGRDRHEGFPTLLAFIGSFPSVCSHVCTKGRGRTMRSPTPAAQIGPTLPVRRPVHIRKEGFSPLCVLTCSRRED